MPPRRTWLSVRAHTACELPPCQVPLARTGSARRGTLHLLQGGGQGGERRSDLQPGDTVEGRFEKPVTYPPKGEGGSEPDSAPSRTSKTFTTVLPSFVDPGLEELLIDNGVEISAKPIQEGGGRSGDAALRLRPGAAPYRRLHLAL